MASSTPTPETRRDSAIARYQAGLEALTEARARNAATAELNKLSGALGGPRLAIANAEADAAEAGRFIEPWQAPKAPSRDSWDEASAREAIARLSQAIKACPFEATKAKLDARLTRALKAAKDHGVSIKA